MFSQIQPLRYNRITEWQVMYASFVSYKLHVIDDGRIYN